MYVLIEFQCLLVVYVTNRLREERNNVNGCRIVIVIIRSNTSRGYIGGQGVKIYFILEIIITQTKESSTFIKLDVYLFDTF